MSNFEVSHHQNFSRITFSAMASPCEVLVRNLEPNFCQRLGEVAYQETIRIERKFSRYIEGNLVDKMNKSHGRKVAIDKEMFRLLEYANDLYQLSDGLFDISSGVLRKVWNYAESATPPSKERIVAQLENIGFDKIKYDSSSFCMNDGMEIDFGGIGKEYAVDQVAELLNVICLPNKSSFLVNFGGDISARKLDPDALPWRVGVEAIGSQHQLVAKQPPNSFITIGQGAVATSGNTKRYLEHQGKRYGHLLNPKTGYPIENAPLSITTFADSCVMAGSFSSLAMLMGAQAEAFLSQQGIKHLCLW